MMDTASKEVETVGDLVDQLAPTTEAALALTESATRMPAPVPEPPTSLLGAIIAASRDRSIDVAKLQALMTMQERIEERQAKREFIVAYARLSGKMPRVKKNGTIDLGAGKGSIPFAKWEDMDKIIRPLMAEEGFSLSFNSAARTEQGGGLIVSGELMHRDGYSRQASIPLPLDTGPGRNNLQAGGSTLQYGKRYVAEMLLNIVREGADDDGKTGADLGTISDEQKAELIALMSQAAALLKKPDEFAPRLLKRLKVETLDELPASRFSDARGLIWQTINTNKKPDAA
jgi:hypothetical protein